ILLGSLPCPSLSKPTCLALLYPHLRISSQAQTHHEYSGFHQQDLYRPTRLSSRSPSPSHSLHHSPPRLSIMPASHAAWRVSWGGLLPAHRSTSNIHIPWKDEDTRTSIETAFQMISVVVHTERQERTLSLELTQDLEESRDDLRALLVDEGRMKFEVDRTITRATKLWIEMARQREAKEMVEFLVALHRANLITRYYPDTKEDMHWCLQDGNPLSRYAENIFREVRIETANFEQWKRSFCAGNISKTSKKQPPCPWNSILKSVSTICRVLHATEDNPDPLSFDNIMVILAESYARRREFFEPNSLTSVDDLREMDADVAVPIMVHDLWFFRQFLEDNDTFSFQNMGNLISAELCFRVSNFTVSPTGHMRRGWLKDSDTQINHRIRRDGWLREGIPGTRIWLGKLFEVREPPADWPSNFQWEVDCFEMRDEYYSDWQNTPLDPDSPLLDDLPLYEPQPQLPSYAPQVPNPTSQPPNYNEAGPSE
ncbi:hypothetical protein BGZ63DRAFT_439737, partial [Mariannaea sp. PMI_226]